MRHKEYIETCEICHKTYIATRKGSTVCSNVCRAQKSRDKHSIQFKSQAQVIQTQAEIIKVVLPKAVDLKPIPEIRNTGGSFKKRSDPAWLTSTLDGILFPSVSKWRAGKFNSAEIKEFTRVAKEMGLTLDEYMKEIEVRKENSPEAIRKLFE
jgi:adenine-specific DNA methylase